MIKLGEESKEYIASKYDKITKDCSKAIRSAYNPTYWVINNIRSVQYFFENQIEILDAMCDPSQRNIAILQARGAGKTFAVAVGIVKLCIDIPGFTVGVFGPREKQAERILDEIRKQIAMPGSSIYKSINWYSSTKSRIFFKNGSEITALSADPTSQQEGWHFHMAVIDEAHRVDDVVMNQKIAPMLGTLPYAKTVKLGIAVGKNNFWKSCVNDARYLVLQRDWTRCPALLMFEENPIFYNGKEYSRYVVEQLPLSIKQKLFPDRPDLHIDGNMTELDYFTQYAMEWSDDIFLELDKEHQQLLVSGNHDILDKARQGFQDRYFFGLDTAPGSLIPGKKDLDFTVLSVWRLQSDGVKEKVKCYEWQGNVSDQLDEIQTIIDPKEGIFPCVFGLADFSNTASGNLEYWQKKGIPIDGVIFKQTEKISKKNYKNAMYNNFKFELEHSRVKYPVLDVINKDKVFKKSFNEWCNIERHIKTAVNDDISAPSDLHDDHCDADVLAVWAMDKGEHYDIAKRSFVKMPKPRINEIPPVYNRHVSTKRKENKYLK